MRTFPAGEQDPESRTRRAGLGEQDPDERLCELEAMLNAITEYQIIKLDLSGNIASWNPGAKAVQGYSAHEAVGKPVSIFFTEERSRLVFRSGSCRLPARQGGWSSRAGTYARTGTSDSPPCWSTGWVTARMPLRRRGRQ
jgi:PAS domain-containing protein